MTYRITLIIGLAIVSFTMLIGRQLGLTQFGESGFVRYPDLLIQDTIYKRGSTYVFLKNETMIPYPSLALTGEINTPIVFLDTREDTFTIQEITGRLTIDGRATIRIHKTDVRVQGMAEIIHYSWKNEMEITLQEGLMDLIIGENRKTISAPFHATFSTDTGYAISIR